MTELQSDSGLRDPSSALFRHRETGAGAFYERWQREFGLSRHPLSRALRRMVRLEELKKCSAMADYLYSRSTFKLIDDAKTINSTTTVERPHRPVVRLSGVVATLLLRVHGSPETAHDKGDQAIEQRLASTLRVLRSTAALDEARLDRDRGDSSKSSHAEEWMLDPDLVDTCALAAYLTQQIRGGDAFKVDLDHFIIALLLNPRSQALIFETFLEIDFGSPSLKIGDILRDVLANLPQPYPTFWDEILQEIDERTLAASSQVDLETRLPDYVADRPIERLRDDLLDFRADARAVAEIICQSKPGPPLAIGLFGDWGSGKSSFMKLLQHEIDQLTDQARMHGRATPFVKRAAHVIFNAWQYNDTQLWPALAENTFAQLRAGGAEGLNRQIWQQVLEEIDKQVGDLEESADGLALELMQVQHQETEERDKLLTAEDERDTRIRDARSEAITAVSEHVAKVGGSSTPAAERGNTAAELIDAVADTSKDAGIGLWSDFAKAIGITWQLKAGRWLLLIGLPLAAFFGGIVWIWSDVLLGRLGSIGNVLATIAPLLLIAGWFFRFALPLGAAHHRVRACPSATGH